MEIFEKMYNDKMKNIENYQLFFEETLLVLKDMEKLTELMDNYIEKYDNKFWDFKGNNKLKISLFSMFYSKYRDIRSAWIKIDMYSFKLIRYVKKYMDIRFLIDDNREYLKQLKEIYNYLDYIIKNEDKFIKFIENKK